MDHQIYAKTAPYLIVIAQVVHIVWQLEKDIACRVTMGCHSIQISPVDVVIKAQYYAKISIIVLINSAKHARTFIMTVSIVQA